MGLHTGQVGSGGGGCPAALRRRQPPAHQALVVGIGDVRRLSAKASVGGSARGHCRGRILTQTPSAPTLSCARSYDWVDDETLVASVVPEGAGPPPPTPSAPLGPRVEDNTEGRTSQSRTYPDLLKSTHDEALFEYYTSAELVSIQVGACLCLPVAGVSTPPGTCALPFQLDTARALQVGLWKRDAAIHIRLQVDGCAAARRTVPCSSPAARADTCLGGAPRLRFPCRWRPASCSWLAPRAPPAPGPPRPTGATSGCPGWSDPSRMRCPVGASPSACSSGAGPPLRCAAAEAARPSSKGPAARSAPCYPTPGLGAHLDGRPPACLACRDGSLVRELAALPLAEEIPIAFDSCRKGPRGFEWRSDKPAEVSWTECQVSTCPCPRA